MGRNEQKPENQKVRGCRARRLATTPQKKEGLKGSKLDSHMFPRMDSKDY